MKNFFENPAQFFSKSELFLIVGMREEIFAAQKGVKF